MLIQMKEIKTKTYPLDQGFMLDIVNTCKNYEAWIYHKDIGTKEFMFGCPKKQQSYEEFLDIIEWNIEEYVKTYEEINM